MELHLVGGFLGSGKTTAIIQAARLLTKLGQRVGIITNEQGKHLVDTAFIRSGGLPALEVTGGCICCNLDDFEQRVEEIAKRYAPQIIFAESVGSCADLVATVIKPLSDFHKSSARPASLSVFADSRLLLRFLHGQELPFSEGVIYIFEKQIEESGLVVVNKIDLLSEGDVHDVVHLAQARYPEKQIRPQNSLDEGDVNGWLALIQSRTMALPALSLDLDYDVYAAGEGKFAWLDRGIEMDFSGSDSGISVAALIGEIVSAFSVKDFHIAHLKFLVISQGQTVKINQTGMDDFILANELDKVYELKGSRISLLVNAMVEGDAALLEGQLNNIIIQFGEEKNIMIRETARFTRVPGYPKPTKRIGN